MEFQSEENTLDRVICLFLDIVEEKKEYLLKQQTQWNTDPLETSTVFHMNYDSNFNFNLEEHEVEKQLNDVYESSDPKEHFQKQNMIKNILKSFLKFILGEKDKNIQQQLMSKYNSCSQIPYSDIKKSLSKKIKDKRTRWNFKLKSIIQSNKFQPIFYYYLTQNSSGWLSKSRVSHIEQHQKLINQLITLIQNGEQFNMKVYKKK